MINGRSEIANAASAPMNSELAQTWNRICSFELDDVDAEKPFSAVLAEEMDWDAPFTQLAISEYKRFMLLVSIFDDRMVPSIDVDTVWHLHLLYTRSYQKFCRGALGLPFVHHEPAKGNSGENAEYKQLYRETLARYRELFGKPPEIIWGGEAGVFGKAPLASLSAESQ
jgi:hypothetical protein